MGYVFISYSRVDKVYAQNLTNELRRHGLDVWIDDRIEYGERWWQTIVSAIMGCSAFVVVMTPEAEKSEWVEREILLAQRENKPLYPLLLRGREFPLLITSQFVNVANGQSPPKDFFETLRPIVGSRAGTGHLLTPPKAKMPKRRRQSTPQGAPFPMTALPRAKKKPRGCDCVISVLILIAIMVAAFGIENGQDGFVGRCNRSHGILFGDTSQTWRYYAEDGEQISLWVKPLFMTLDEVRVYDAHGEPFFEGSPNPDSGLIFLNRHMPWTGNYFIEVRGPMFAIYTVELDGPLCDAD